MGLPSPFPVTPLHADAGVGLADVVRQELLEVVQVVQNAGHDVPLIAGKATVVRCCVQLASGAAAIACRGELEITRADGTITVSSLNAVSAAVPGPGGVQELREDLSKTLNFLLPAGACAEGTARITLVSLAAADSPQNPIKLEDAAGSRDVTFVTAPPLRVKLFSIRYRGGNPVRDMLPSSRDLDLTESWLRRAYPVAAVVSARAVVDAPAGFNFNCTQVNLILAGLRRQDIAAGLHPTTRYYGMVSDGNSNATFMRGCASQVPSQPAPETVASGPCGSSPFGWDYDGSYADWYTGHELAHTFGRAHPGYCSGNSHDDTSFPYPDGRISPVSGEFVGLDMGDPELGLPMTAYPGQNWHDVMTYCKFQWMSAYTFAGIHERMKEEDQLYGALPPAAPLGGMALDAAPAVTGLIQVLAAVDIGANTADIFQVTPVSRGVPTPAAAASNASIVILDGNGVLLSSTPVEVRESSCSEGETHRHGIIDVLLEAPEQARTVVLEIAGETKDKFTAEGMPDAANWLQEQSQKATTPAPLGFQMDKIEWPAGVRYTIQVSTDAGVTWQTVATGLPEPDFHPDPRAYPGVQSLTMKVTATNGFATQSTVLEVPLR